MKVFPLMPFRHFLSSFLRHDPSPTDHFSTLQGDKYGNSMGTQIRVWLLKLFILYREIFQKKGLTSRRNLSEPADCIDDQVPICLPAKHLHWIQ